MEKFFLFELSSSNDQLEFGVRERNSERVRFGFVFVLNLFASSSSFCSLAILHHICFLQWLELLNLVPQLFMWIILSSFEQPPISCFIREPDTLRSTTILFDSILSFRKFLYWLSFLNIRWQTYLLKSRQDFLTSKLSLDYTPR